MRGQWQHPQQTLGQLEAVAAMTEDVAWAKAFAQATVSLARTMVETEETLRQAREQVGHEVHRLQAANDKLRRRVRRLEAVVREHHGVEPEEEEKDDPERSYMGGMVDDDVSPILRTFAGIGGPRRI